MGELPGKLAENRDIYARLNRLLETHDIADTQTLFFNWGYADSADDKNWMSAAIAPPRGVNAHHIRLVLELIGDTVLDGKSVLDIGCGRGGTLKTIAGHFQPKKLTGIDVSPDNIAFCQRHLGLRKARFQVADACQMHFHTRSTDIAVNLESSGAYPNFVAFLSEVSRVLKPRGSFLFGDILPAALVGDIVEALDCLGLELIRERSVTENVLAARGAAGAAEGRLFNPERLRASDPEGRLAAFLQSYRADTGSRINGAMADGALTYHLFQFRKGDGPAKPLPAALTERLKQRDRLFHALIDGLPPSEATSGADIGWFPFGSPARNGKLKVFALPHAGGAASVYREWCGAFGPDIEFCPLQLPGREQRIAEPVLRDVDAVAEGCIQAIAPFRDRPFVLMGHSLGARIAFEMALRLQNLPNTRLVGLIAAGCPAPDIPTGMRASHMDVAALREQLRKLGGTPEGILQDAAAFQAHEAAIRADFAIGENYFRTADAKITAPLLTIAAADDHHVSATSVRGWERFTSGAVRHEAISGGHFFVKSGGQEEARSCCRVFLGELTARAATPSVAEPIDTKWLPFGLSRKRAELRLFCLAFAGGSANYFQPWFKEMPAGIELCPIELPGRGTRFAERPCAEIEDLIPAMAEGLRAHLDRPFAIFGHSLGALNAFALCDHLRQSGDMRPVHLFVSGRRAPQRPVRQPLRHLMPDDELMTELQGLGGMAPEISENREVMSLMLPLLRADFRLTERYAHNGTAPLAIPMTAFTGGQDPEVPPEEMAQWCDVAGAAFDMECFEGGHFYLNCPRARGKLLHRIGRELLRHLGA